MRELFGVDSLLFGFVISSRTPDVRRPALRGPGSDLFSQRVRAVAAENPLRPVRILAVGCGDPAMAELDLPHVCRHVTGIDDDTSALRAHAEARRDLDVVQLGDLRTARLPPRAFDVVYSAYLVERTPHAELVLDRCVSALRPGGLLLLRLRDRDSAAGFLHRLAHLVPGLSVHPSRPAGGRHAGDAVRPLPAVYGPLASARGIHWFALMRGLSIAEEYATRGPGDDARPLDTAARLLHVLTRGRLSADHTELVYVIRNPENRAARLL